MKPLPFPLRVAAGLAVTTAERVHDLPKQLTGLPVTVASQVLQLSMRVQQHVTELAVKGDDVLSRFRPVEDEPSWATFDEDLEADLPAPATPSGAAHGKPPAGSANGSRPDGAVLRTVPDLPDAGGDAAEADPWADEERALAADHVEGEFDSTTAPAGDGPAGLDDYDDLTLPQLRARLRRFSLVQLEELLAYERDHANRPSFIGMLARRAGNVVKGAQDTGDTATETGTAGPDQAGPAEQ